MSDSPQKILKELSDLTRNLDVLAKEIRGMNKATASVQDAVVKSAEKKEAADEKSGDKSSKSSLDLGKLIADSIKGQEGMFSKLVEGIKKNSEENERIKESTLEGIKNAGIEGIKNAGQTLLETKSLKDAKEAGLSSVLSSGKDSIVESIRGKNNLLGEISDVGLSYLVDKIPGALKKKEKVKKEEDGASVAKESEEKKIKEGEKKEKKSILEKLNIKRKSKEEKIEASKEKTAEEKTEKKGLLSRLREKISGKDTKNGDTLSDLSKEKISQKDSASDSATSEVQEKKEPPSLKALTPGIVPEKNSEEMINLKERSKQIFQKTTLGSTIKSFSDAIKKKRSEEMSTPSSAQNDPEKLSVRSKIEKFGTELKSKFRFKKKEAATKEKSEAPSDKGTSASAEENKPKESKEPEKVMSSKSEDKKNESDKDNKPEITAQDIADIKALLASMNSALNGPLNIRDNKPYRPHSHML